MFSQSCDLRRSLRTFQLRASRRMRKFSHELALPVQVSSLHHDKRTSYGPDDLRRDPEGAIGPSSLTQIPHQRPRMFVSIVPVLEDLVSYFRMYAWWILVQSRATLRFSDHRGLHTKSTKVVSESLAGSLTHSKTIGSCVPPYRY